MCRISKKHFLKLKGLIVVCWQQMWIKNVISGIDKEAVHREGTYDQEHSKSAIIFLLSSCLELFRFLKHQAILINHFAFLLDNTPSKAERKTIWSVKIHLLCNVAIFPLGRFMPGIKTKRSAIVNGVT